MEKYIEKNDFIKVPMENKIFYLLKSYHNFGGRKLTGCINTLILPLYDDLSCTRLKYELYDSKCIYDSLYNNHCIDILIDIPNFYDIFDSKYDFRHR